MIDASIYQNIRPFRLDDPAEIEAKQLQVEATRLGAEQARQGALDDKVARELAPLANGDLNKLVGLYNQRGLYKPAQALQRQIIDQEKTRADIGKIGADTKKAAADTDYRALETQHKKLDIIGQAFGAVLKNPTPQTAESVIAYLEGNGIMPPQAAAKMRADIASGDPVAIRQIAEHSFRTALATKDQLPKIETRNLGGTTQTIGIDPVTGQASILNSAANTQSPDSVASVAATMRGQNMQDARSRETLAQGRNQYDAERGGIVNLQTGAFTPATQNGAPVAPKDKLTEIQGKSTAFGMRARVASDVLDSVGKDGKVQPGVIKRMAESTPWVGEGLGTVANITQSAAQQQVEQAQRDFINAVLRLESGAAISESEFINARKQYFPQPGDTNAVIAQKRRNRETEIAGLGVMAGPGAKHIKSQTNAVSGSIKPPSEMTNAEIVKALSGQN